MNDKKLMDRYFSFSYPYGSMTIDVLGFRGEEVMVFVDSGFKAQGEQLKRWLCQQGYNKSVVLLSHLHKDHYQGVLELDPEQIIGPSLFEHGLPDELESMRYKYRSWDDSIRIVDGLVINHRPTGGHSGCSALLKLDNQLLHVGDLIILNGDGRFSLPLVMGNIDDYIKALNQIITSKCDGFLGHGGYLPAKKLVYGAERTLDYLVELQRVGCAYSVEDLSVLKHYPYSNLKYHAFNWRYHRGKSHE